MITYLSRPLSEHSTDTLLQILRWIAGRQRYRRTCGIVDGPAYAEECKMEDAAAAELEKRGRTAWKF
jgi:hypothetical protein